MNDLIERVRNLPVVDPDWVGDPEFANGYAQGQQDVLDRVVELLEEHALNDEHKASARAQFLCQMLEPIDLSNAKWDASS